MNQDHSQPPPNTRVRGLKILSLLTLLAERITRCGWRLFCWCALFSAFWLFEIQNIGGPWFGVLLLIIAAIGTIYLFYIDLLRFRWPSENDILRRLEKESAVRHRPLSSLKDAPINKEAQALWEKEQTRRKSLLSSLKPPSPRPFLARQDPYALRLALVLCVICGFVVAGSGWQGRFWSGLTPFNLPQADFIKQEAVTFWITPPEYTGLERITPVVDDETALQIPQGSSLKAFIAPKFISFIRPPVVQIDEGIHEMQKAADGSHSIELEIPNGQSLSVRPGLIKTLSWNYTLIPDKPPALSIAEEPKILGHAQMQFAVELHDDYGVENLHMSMTLDPLAQDVPPEEIADSIFKDKRSIMSPADTKFNIAPVYDLASHPWAGLPVTFTFTASDHLGQISQDAELNMKLPERAFTHPIAKKIIEIRKDLIWNPEKPYTNSFVSLNELSQFPHKFSHDPKVFLALRVAASRMRYNEPSFETSKSLIALLWDTALRVEDGNLSLAARDLREAQEALEKALQDPNTSDAEIAFLMQKMREALAEYLKAMAMELQKEMQQAQQSGQQMGIPPELLSQMLNMSDLAGLLDQMESEMLSGNRDAAQEMLSQLQRLTDMANPSMSMAMPQDMQMMMEGINELQNLIERQEELLSTTEKQSELLKMLGGLGMDYGRALPPNSSLMNEWDMQRMPPQPHSDGRNLPKTPFIDTSENVEEQEALRKILGELMLKADAAMNEIPESLGLAEQAMRTSTGTLERNRPDMSVPYQEEVLRHLKDSQQQMAQQMAQRMQQMTGLSFSSAPMQYDPLGRPYGGQEDPNGNAHGSHVKVPSEAEVKRVQEILDELRRRAGQRGRPREELDYYRRLLKRF